MRREEAPASARHRLPHAADVVIGVLTERPCSPEDLPSDVTVRPLEPADWSDVRRIDAEGIATGHATFETEVPGRRELDQRRLPRHPVGGRGRRAYSRLGRSRSGLAIVDELARAERRPPSWVIGWA